MKKNCDVNSKSEIFETDRLFKEQYSICCRICHTVISNEKLISPCFCKGSLEFVHLSCLERWLNQSGRDTCELCLFRFEAEQTRRYSIRQGLRIWYRHPRHLSQLKADLVIGLVLTGVTLGLCIICLGGMKYFVIEGFRVGISYMWTEGVISFFLAVIVVAYLTTVYLMLRDHLVPWYHWWNRCVNVRLILDMYTSNEVLTNVTTLNERAVKPAQQDSPQNNDNQNTVIFIPEISSPEALATTTCLTNTSIPSVMSAVMSHICQSIDTSAMTPVQPTKTINENFEEENNIDSRSTYSILKMIYPQTSQTDSVTGIPSQSSHGSDRSNNPALRKENH